MGFLLSLKPSVKAMEMKSPLIFKGSPKEFSRFSDFLCSPLLSLPPFLKAFSSLILLSASSWRRRDIIAAKLIDIVPFVILFLNLQLMVRLK